MQILKSHPIIILSMSYLTAGYASNFYKLKLGKDPIVKMDVVNHEFQPSTLNILNDFNKYMRIESYSNSETINDICNWFECKEREGFKSIFLLLKLRNDIYLRRRIDKVISDALSYQSFLNNNRVSYQDDVSTYKLPDLNFHTNISSDRSVSLGVGFSLSDIFDYKVSANTKIQTPIDSMVKHYENYLEQVFLIRISSNPGLWLKYKIRRDLIKMFPLLNG